MRKEGELKTKAWLLTVETRPYVLLTGNQIQNNSGLSMANLCSQEPDADPSVLTLLLTLRKY